MSKYNDYLTEVKTGIIGIDMSLFKNGIKDVETKLKGVGIHPTDVSEDDGIAIVMLSKEDQKIANKMFGNKILYSS